MVFRNDGLTALRSALYDQVVLGCDAAPGATGYRWERRANIGAWSVLAETSSPAHTNPDSPLAMYEYRASLVEGGQVSAPTAQLVSRKRST